MKGCPGELGGVGKGENDSGGLEAFMSMGLASLLEELIRTSLEATAKMWWNSDVLDVMSLQEVTSQLALSQTAPLGSGNSALLQPVMCTLTRTPHAPDKFTPSGIPDAQDMSLV